MYIMSGRYERCEMNICKWPGVGKFFLLPNENYLNAIVKISLISI